MAFVFSYSFIAVLSMIATVIVTSESCNNKTLSLKELSSRILKSLRRTIATGVYTTIFVIGYVFLVIYLAGPVLSNSSSNPFTVLGYGLLFSMFAYIVYLYMSSVWILGLVVSVLDEESCGLVALGKSSAMIKKYRFNGFFLNIFLNLMTLALFIGLKIVKGHNNWLSDDPSILSGLYLVNCSCLVKIFSFVAYTVLYFECKENPDEEIELGGYGRISTTTPLFSGIP
ncbi:uncharacterized protein LOC142550266 [Primulina tabacum]|uniref:uncharacterized protein LOC142550266 n=1 Tax=Primulina tabacum TaxID=48773 RepID=UPI003F598186